GDALEGAGCRVVGVIAPQSVRVEDADDLAVLVELPDGLVLGGVGEGEVGVLDEGAEIFGRADVLAVAVDLVAMRLVLELTPIAGAGDPEDAAADEGEMIGDAEAPAAADGFA